VNTHLSATMCTFIQAPRRLAAIEGFPARAGLSLEPGHRNPRPWPSSSHGAGTRIWSSHTGYRARCLHADVPAAPGQLRVWVPPVLVVVE
jgi:hypothetical protein